MSSASRLLQVANKATDKRLHSKNRYFTSFFKNHYNIPNKSAIIEIIYLEREEKTMRELWPLDIGWTYTILGGLRRSEEISLRHSDLSFPATVAPMEDSHRLVLEKQLHIKEEWAGTSFIL